MAQNKNNPIVWQLSVLELDGKTLIEGVIIDSLPFAHDKQTGLFKNFIKSLSSFFIKVYAQKEIKIVLDHNAFKTKTNAYGSFKLVNNQQLQNGDISITTSDGEKLKVVQSYPIIFRKTKGEIDVISDVDDTLVVSYTKNIFKRISSILFTPPRKRRPIGFTQNLLNVFDKKNARVHYISKSESNLFAMLTSIIQLNNLPKGNLILTSYLKFRQLFNPEKGLDYKLNQISFIIENTKDKSYILIGDDTQKDMETYAKIVKKFPDKILKVYIRQTKTKVHTYQKIMLNNLKDTGVDHLYFNDDSSIDFDTEYKNLKDKLS